MKNLNFFIFSDTICLKCCSSIKELDEFIDAHPKDTLEYIMMPFSSIDEFNRNGTFKSGVFTPHSNIAEISTVNHSEIFLADLINSILAKLPSDKQSILKNGVLISELNSRVSCDQDSLNYLSNKIEYGQIFSENEVIIYNTLNQKMIVSLEVLKLVYKQALQYNVLFTEKYNSVKEKLPLIEDFEELKTLISELYI